MEVEEAAIPGLLIVRLDVIADPRGWFKENWHREKMLALGVPDFGPVQNNLSFNTSRGATRGFHAEPWDKFVSIASGRAFGVWVDLREGPSFGTVVDLELDPAVAVFVPRGVANGYQSLVDSTTYSYLVNDHWSADKSYPAVDLGDHTLAVPWPIPLDRATISDKDRHLPSLQQVTPVPPRRTLITGASGQVGRALADEFPDAHAVTRADLDIADPDAVAAWPWQEYAVILNAAAYTDVDGAETTEGRRAAWAVNALGPAALARMATSHRLTLVHFSTDYVFDGTVEAHFETEVPSPLGVYGQSKAAGELAVAGTPRHYLIRTSWVVGDGANFVRTMQRLASEGATPAVVDDQWGRLTFTDELARALRHLLSTGVPFGTYNVTNAGPATTWADVATAVFSRSGRSATDVRPVSSAQYSAERPQIAPRPRHGDLSLEKLRATGFEPTPASEALDRFLLLPQTS